MRLLFDQNLSHRLVDILADCYPKAVHVRNIGLAKAGDDAVWTHAAENDLTIVSKDSDFHQRSLLFGAPPKVIWIHTGNCTTQDVATVLRRHQADIESFQSDATASFLVFA